MLGRGMRSVGRSGWMAGARGLSRSAAVGERVTADSLNGNVLAAEYAVRGQIVIRAGEYEAQLARGEGGSLPFDKVVYCNIGNPQQLGQQPITFMRQVLSLCDNPQLMDEPALKGVYPEDVFARADKYLSSIPGGTGAYSHSQGVPVVRDEVATFLQERDGVPANPADLFLTDGASPAVQLVMRSILRDKSDGVLIPIPQYPLYTASIALFGGSPQGYFLDEESGWSTGIGELARAYEQGKKDGLNLRAVAVINPGNPTGGVLERDSVAEVAHFCAERGLVLLADEVYQENVYAAGKAFHSFKKVAVEEGLVDATDKTGTKSKLQLASFHSVSKGFLGECGRRGGYLELCGFDDATRAQLYKVASISLCSNIAGQLTVGMMTQPPKEGDASYAQYASERDGILASLQRRANTLTEAFADMEGVSCAVPEGALYAFPQIRLPAGVQEAAKAKGMAADAYYCTALLDATGVVVVPGSGFGQVDGTFHFRTTILPPEHEIEAVATSLAKFHADFLQKHQ